MIRGMDNGKDLVVKDYEEAKVEEVLESVFKTDSFKLAK